jgi:hypothetical protein
VLRLGFITELLSKPIRYGYMNGIALTVLISQLPKLLGFSIESDGPLRDVWRSARRSRRQRNWTPSPSAPARSSSSCCSSASSAARRADRVVGATSSSACSTCAARGVSVLGSLPQGLPASRCRGSPRRPRPV